MRSRHATALLLVLFFALLTPRPADGPLAAEPNGNRVTPVAAESAPPPVESEYIARELLHTDRLITVLRPKISRSGNTKAQEQLAESMKREKEAQDAYNQNLYARAARLTREARSMAREAAVMVGPPEEDPVYVSRTIDHAKDALALAEDALRGVDDSNVQKRYNGLSNELDGARQLYKTGAMRRAYEQANTVRDGVLALLTDFDDLPVAGDTASKVLKSAERAVERAGQELGPSPTAAALRLQREAQGQLAKARASFARKDYRDAVIHSKLVERNLDDAVAAQRSGPRGPGSDA